MSKEDYLGADTPSLIESVFVMSKQTAQTAQAFHATLTSWHDERKSNEGNRWQYRWHLIQGRGLRDRLLGSGLLTYSRRICENRR